MSKGRSHMALECTKRNARALETKGGKKRGGARHCQRADVKPAILDGSLENDCVKSRDVNDLIGQQINIDPRARGGEDSTNESLSWL